MLKWRSALIENRVRLGHGAMSERRGGFDCWASPWWAPPPPSSLGSSAAAAACPPRERAPAPRPSRPRSRPLPASIGKVARGFRPPFVWPHRCWNARPLGARPAAAAAPSCERGALLPPPSHLCPLFPAGASVATGGRLARALLGFGREFCSGGDSAVDGGAGGKKNITRWCRAGARCSLITTTVRRPATGPRAGKGRRPRGKTPPTKPERLGVSRE